MPKRKRITSEALQDIRDHIAWARTEPAEFARDAAGEIIMEYGKPKYLPARRCLNVPDRMVRALRLPPADIRTLRKSLGLTQAAMAQRVGVSTRTYHSWESGEGVPSDPCQRTLLRLQRDADRLPPLTPEMIRQAREAWQHTKASYARELRVSAMSVGRWEAGTATPRPDKAKEIFGDYQFAVATGLIK